MKRLLFFCAVAATLGLLQACSSDQTTSDSSATLYAAMQDNPSLATQILPISHLDSMDNWQPQAVSAVAYAAAVKTAATDGPLTISVADLERATNVAGQILFSSTVETSGAPTNFSKVMIASKA